MCQLDSSQPLNYSRYSYKNLYLNEKTSETDNVYISGFMGIHLVIN